MATDDVTDEAFWIAVGWVLVQPNMSDAEKAEYLRRLGEVASA